MPKHRLHCRICGRWFEGWFAARRLHDHRKHCHQNGKR